MRWRVMVSTWAARAAVTASAAVITAAAASTRAGPGWAGRAVLAAPRPVSSTPTTVMVVMARAVTVSMRASDLAGASSAARSAQVWSARLGGRTGPVTGSRSRHRSAGGGRRSRRRGRSPSPRTAAGRLSCPAGTTGVGHGRAILVQGIEDLPGEIDCGGRGRCSRLDQVSRGFAIPSARMRIFRRAGLFVPCRAGGLALYYRMRAGAVIPARGQPDSGSGIHGAGFMPVLRISDVPLDGRRRVEVTWQDGLLPQKAVATFGYPGGDAGWGEGPLVPGGLCGVPRRPGPGAGGQRRAGPGGHRHGPVRPRVRWDGRGRDLGPGPGPGSARCGWRSTPTRPRRPACRGSCCATPAAIPRWRWGQVVRPHPPADRGAGPGCRTRPGTSCGCCW